MTDYYLRFTDEGAAHTVLTATLPGYHGGREASPSWAVSHVGRIVSNTPPTDPDAPYTPTFIAGHHVNVRVADSDLANACDTAFAAYDANPANPVRVWA